ncbi:MAG TPA: GAF domain-containing protein [Elainellaceae cyanobacterium]
MKAAAIPASETTRLKVLHRYKILDTGAEQAFNNLTTLAAQICHSPIALITFVDESRHWFKAKCGIGVNETSRDLGFCAHAILQPDDLLIIPDTLQDERFADNPLVIHEPYIRFYAGAPLLSPDGYALGTLCVIDKIPRSLQSEQTDALKVLACQVISQLELRFTLDELAAVNQKMHQYLAEVNQVTQSAAALEAGGFNADDLSAIASRTDELGQLARVFQHAAQEIVQRETQLQQQLVDLKIEINHVKRANDVAQITRSDYFQELKEELAELEIDEFWQ